MQTNELRLFVSSTFRDLMPEREVLVKKIFPKVRELCRQRGVYFTEIDLRWGITAEEARTGKVVRICLEEIDKCRPHFIGIMGSRYGWQPDEAVLANDPDLVKDYPWLPELIAQGKSITEIEFLHGALLPKNTQSAFIYSRHNTGDQIEEGEAQLAKVRDSVRDVGVPLRSFLSPDELGELVLADLTAIIERDFSLATEPDALTLLRQPHDAFSVNRRRSYVANPEYVTLFDEFVSSDGSPLVLTARSGLGKSSLMAYLTHEYKDRHDAFVVTHFVGASANASGANDIIRHVMTEIKDRYSLSDEIPSEDSRLREEFPLWLAKVQSEKLVLAIDALNQLPLVDNELGWLPEFIPPNVRLVLSTTEGISYDNLHKRNWLEVEVKPLDSAMRRNIAVDFLARYHKTLTDEQFAMIASEAACESPLFLRTVLEELRVFGVYEEYETHLVTCLSSESESELFRHVLSRLEGIYGEESVRSVMRAIWAARYGLTENELLEITGLTRLDLSLLIAGLEYHLMQRGGLYTFFHNYLREGVEARYLPDDESKKAAHRHLANYFSQEEYTIRRRDEEPFQWKGAADDRSLIGSITTMEMLHLFISAIKEYELLGYWINLDHTEMVAAYSKMFEDVEAHQNAEIIAHTSYEIGHFLQRASKPNDALAFLQNALTLSEELYGKESDNLGDILDALTTTYVDLSKFDEGIQATEHKLKTFNETHSNYNFKRCECLVSLSTLAYHKGDLELAKSYCMEVLNLTESDSIQALNQCAQSLGNLTAVYTAQGDLDSALKCNKESIQIHTRIHGATHIETIRMQQNLAIVLMYAKKYDETEENFKQIENILSHTIGKNNLFFANILEAHTDLHYRLKKMDEADKLQDEVIEIRKQFLKVGDPLLIISHLSKAEFCRQNKKFDEAERLYREYLHQFIQLYGASDARVKKSKERFYDVLLKLGKGEEAKEILATIPL